MSPRPKHYLDLPKVWYSLWRVETRRNTNFRKEIRKLFPNLRLIDVEEYGKYRILKIGIPQDVPQEELEKFYQYVLDEKNGGA